MKKGKSTLTLPRRRQSEKQQGRAWLHPATPGGRLSPGRHGGAGTWTPGKARGSRGSAAAAWQGALEAWGLSPPSPLQDAPQAPPVPDQPTHTQPSRHHLGQRRAAFPPEGVFPARRGRDQPGIVSLSLAVAGDRRRALFRRGAGPAREAWPCPCPCPGGAVLASRGLRRGSVSRSSLRAEPGPGVPPSPPRRLGGVVRCGRRQRPPRGGGFPLLHAPRADFISVNTGRSLWPEEDGTRCGVSQPCLNLLLVSECVFIERCLSALCSVCRIAL